ncbi:hypothetical protein AWV80_04345 [Cupriavidus sp. UYMU48A]|nr:hypothetical protein AWV80_04345 [Cupriavidus sp. UYMU48A]
MASGPQDGLMLVTAAGLSQAAVAAATDERIHQPGTDVRTASSPDARAASAPAPRPSARDTGPSTMKPVDP